jgi:peptidyl-tRNA hydrolase
MALWGKCANKNHIEGEVKLYQISTEAVSQGIKYPAEIYDAGKTQLETNTFTALGIEPAPYYKIDPLVKDLKYL